MRERGSSRRCPYCLEVFEKAEALWVCEHPSLRDLENVANAGLRLVDRSGLRKNAKGQLVDPLGRRVERRACKHCRRLLAPELLKRRCRMIAVVGWPRSGKSTLIGSMLHLSRAGLEVAGIAMTELIRGGDKTPWSLQSELFDAAGSDENVQLPTDLVTPTLLLVRQHKSWDIVVVHEVNVETLQGVGRAAEAERRRIEGADAIVCVLDPLQDRGIRRSVARESAAAGGERERHPLLSPASYRDNGVVIREVVSAMHRTRAGILAAVNVPPVAVCLTKLDEWVAVRDKLTPAEPEPQIPAGRLAQIGLWLGQVVSAAPRTSTREVQTAAMLSGGIVTTVNRHFPARGFFSVQALGTPVTVLNSASGDHAAPVFVRPSDLCPRGSDQVWFWILSQLFPAYTGIPQIKEGEP